MGLIDHALYTLDADNEVEVNTPAIDALMRCRYQVWKIPFYFAFRPKAIAAKWYKGNIEYDKVLMLFNGLTSVNDFQPNTLIRLPFQSDIDALVSLDLNDKDNDGEGEVVEI